MHENRVGIPGHTTARALTVLMRCLVAMYLVAGPHTTLASSLRVISTDASITAIVEALGAASQLVAVDVTSRPAAPYADLPRVGYHRALAAEGLLALRPDLLLASAHAGPAQTLDTLRQAGVAIVRVPAAQDVATLVDNAGRIASALGMPAAASPFQARLQALQAAIQARRLTGLRTVLLREGEGGVRVAGANTAGAALISLVGGYNAVNYRGYRVFSDEALLAADPELLIITTDTPLSAREWLARHALLQHTQAAREGRVGVVSAGGLVGGMSLPAMQDALSLLERLETAGSSQQGVSSATTAHDDGAARRVAIPEGP